MTTPATPVSNAAPSAPPDRFDAALCQSRCAALARLVAGEWLYPLPSADRPAPCLRWGLPPWSAGTCERRAREWEKARLECGIPKRYLRARPDTPPLAGQERSWAQGREWLSQDAWPSLLLFGPTGIGKSWLASVLAQSLMPERTARWVDVATFNLPDAQVIKEWARVGILVFDDLGCEWDRPGGTYAGNRLDALVRAAHANDARLIVTTNLDRAARVKRYPAPMLARLERPPWVVGWSKGEER